MYIVLIAVLGACLGSFINVVINRLPHKKSIILPASYCNHCGKTIPFYHNIPIISFLLLWGKCKFCSTKIHIHHIIVELVTPIVLLILYFVYGNNLLMFGKYSLLFIFLIPVFFIDLYHKLILDKLTIPLAVIGLAFSLLPNADVAFLEALITMIGVSTILLLIAWIYEKFRNIEGIGGGDIKLLAALATFVGALSISFIVFISSLLAVVISLSFKKSKEHAIPFGPFLVVTTMAWVLMGNLFLQWYINLF